MTRATTLAHVFVELVPEQLEEATLYISTTYATVVHRCCCGCGCEVVTPLAPTDWRLIFDGETVSLDPSIGNWSFPCRSHYWIERSRVRWARSWSLEEVESGRATDRAAKAAFYGARTSPPQLNAAPVRPVVWWRRLLRRKSRF